MNKTRKRAQQKHRAKAAKYTLRRKAEAGQQAATSGSKSRTTVTAATATTATPARSKSSSRRRAEAEEVAEATTESA